MIQLVQKSKKKKKVCRKPNDEKKAKDGACNHIAGTLRDITLLKQFVTQRFGNHKQKSISHLNYLGNSSHVLQKSSTLNSVLFNATVTECSSSHDENTNTAKIVHHNLHDMQVHLPL